MTYNARKGCLYLMDCDLFQSTKKTCRGNYIYTDPSNTLCSQDLERVDEVHMCKFYPIIRILVYGN